MIISIHQPSYFPWLGLLEKISTSDKFILLDTVQLNDNAFQSRNIFLNHNGLVQYLSLPIEKKGYSNKLIKDLKLANNTRWQKKHHGFFISNYKKHKYFDEIFPLIEHIFYKEYSFLVDVLLDSLYVSNKIFSISTPIQPSSLLAYDDKLVKDDLVIDILKKCNASHYLSGVGAKSYQDDNKFIGNNIKLIYQEFSAPIYKQKNSTNFKPHLSCLDIAFNIGLNKCQTILQKNLYLS